MLNLGADASASSNLIFAVIAKEVLGLNVNIVRGYTGAANLFLAMARRARRAVRRPELDQERPARSVEPAGVSRRCSRSAAPPAIPTFPTCRSGASLPKDASALALIDFAELPFFIALPFAAPPGVPTDRANALQDAFMAMCRDKAFLEDAEKTGIDMSPIDGAGVLQMLAKTAATPKPVIARYNAIGGERK